MKKKVGRPKKKLSAITIGQMALEGAKNSEIGAILGVDDETISNNFSHLLTKKRAERRTNLRRKQYTLALSGNIQMLIWLGKQELDQKEPKQEYEHSGDVRLIISKDFLPEKKK